jgi:predicted histidine transporter YuiF (NhaC family)
MSISITTTEKIRHYLPWGLAVFIAFVFVQSLFFKFSNSFETQHIFGTIGDWMAGIGFLQFAAAGFAAYGGYTIGTVELVASILLLIRRTQFLGAAIAFAVISGAIFFHLFTPLGVSVVINEAGDRDGGQLFAMAVLVWLFSLAIAWMRREDLVSIAVGKLAASVH